MAQVEDHVARNLSQLPDFGVELSSMEFTSWLDWMVKIRDPRDCWKSQPTYLISELTYLTIGLLTFIHSRRVGGRFKYLWLATIFHGLTVECAAYWLPDIDNFWHSQTTIVLLGRRLPIHIMMLYPAFIYNASVAISRLRLPNWAEPFAVGICVVLIDIPYDITAVKFLHWTWHDTDPNIFDRHYWVPWNSFYFHATFAASFTFWFHCWRRLIIGKSADKWVAGDAKREMLCAVLTGLCGMPGGVLQFIPFYHPLHDILGVHTENCVALLALTFFLIAWSADRNPAPDARKSPGLKGFNECVLSLILHYSCYLSTVLLFKPEDEVSIGVHEKTGPCNETSPIQTAFGMTLKKRKFLCTSDYDEGYFDFHCLPGGKSPSDGMEFYTACGTPFPNRAEYIVVIAGICWIASLIFLNLHFRSGSEAVYGNSNSTGLAEKKKKKK
ncbi:uncharacterized protein LOC124311188 [Daphnia pulicaria]|uniref:uncharacterized protein LOC124311188 n=1 Tax=Daphnia pulicaria TaxID=35523 RepID=UPI001EEB850B|nr:uncharacterized protein LOC124311188 [Daphnia pulicaria]XP_046631521.1 uncharacterized protein LOC124311188 [Daphnia pulicaria]